jgi:glycine hydroxymethyltransferase
MNVNNFKQYIPLDKSWLTRVGVLDIINGYTDIEKFIDEQKDVNDDVLAIRNASEAWRNNKPINAAESATLYRLLKFASWKFNLNKKFIKEGSLKERSINNDRNIVNFSQTKLLKLDNGTTQWATASVICGDKERLTNPPLKLRETYDAVEHWYARRKNGLSWESKYDVTIEGQAEAFLNLLQHNKTNYKPLCSDDYCFARVFNFINKENGAKFWPSLIGHETNRIEEMENAIMMAEETSYVTSKDHRVVQALAMWGVVSNKKLSFKNPNSVKKSWPKFWAFLNQVEQECKNKKFSNPKVKENLTDREIVNLISNEIKKERNTICLIPSENVMSKLASSTYTLNSNNRYVIKSKIDSRYFMPGRENLGNIISILESKLCTIYDVQFAITKGLSGIHNMDIVMSAMAKIASKIVIIDTLSGGHSKTRGIAVKNGFEVETINLDFTTWDLDYKNINKIIKKWRDKKVFMYIDHTVSVNPIDVEKLMRHIPKSWIVYYDISHLQLFYFTHIFKFPKLKNFFFGGSTHKTLPRPQKSIVLLNNKKLYDLVDSEFVKNTSSVHTGSLLALLVTVLEMEKFGKKYAEDILMKTRLFAKLLNKELAVVGPMPSLTNTHQICIDIPNIVEITQKLASIGIITMPMRIPSKNRSGLRLGVQELCRLGLQNKDLKVLSEIIISCIKSSKSNSSLKSKVEVLAKKLYGIQYVLPYKKYF